MHHHSGELSDSLFIFASRTRHCVSHWNNWNLKKIWKTLFGIMAPGTRFLNLPHLSTMRILTHPRYPLLGLSRDPPSLPVTRKDPAALLHPYRTTNPLMIRTSLVSVLAVVGVRLAVHLPMRLPYREMARKNQRQVLARRRMVSMDESLLRESLSVGRALHQHLPNPFRAVILLTRRFPTLSSSSAIGYGTLTRTGILSNKRPLKRGRRRLENRIHYLSRWNS